MSEPVTHDELVEHVRYLSAQADLLRVVVGWMLPSDRVDGYAADLRGIDEEYRRRRAAQRDEGES
jgi:hypothetical protein